MEIKLFGKTLFEAKKSRANHFIELASNERKQSKYLPDFYDGWNDSNPISEYVVMQDISSGGAVAIPKDKLNKKGKKTDGRKVHIELTPKGVYQCQMLNDKTFKLKVDPEYVESQLADFKDKLALITAEEYDMRRGVSEINSVVMRLENRKKYEEFKDFFDQFPYTQTTKIKEMEKVHTNLKLGQIAQFIADMPKEATQVMKEYNEKCNALCGKQAVFYIIADKKDFKNTNTRRDPILLAQSPFGHFWQILGAWDKEMLFLEEL